MTRRPPLRYIDAAAYIGLPVGTLRAKVARRQVPHLRLGPRLVVFDPDDLDRWLDEHRVSVAETAPAIAASTAARRHERARTKGR